MTYSVQKVLHSIVNFYHHKIKPVHLLKDKDKQVSKIFELQLLSRICYPPPHTMFTTVTISLISLASTDPVPHMKNPSEAVYNIFYLRLFQFLNQVPTRREMRDIV